MPIVEEETGGPQAGCPGPPLVPSQDGTSPPEDIHEGAFCVRLGADDREYLSSALTNDAVHALPIPPDRISQMSSPVMEFHKVDAHSVDVRVVQTFRASFDAELTTLSRQVATMHLMHHHLSEGNSSNPITTICEEVSQDGSWSEQAAATASREVSVPSSSEAAASPRPVLPPCAGAAGAAAASPFAGAAGPTFAAPLVRVLSNAIPEIEEASHSDEPPWEGSTGTAGAGGTRTRRSSLEAAEELQQQGLGARPSVLDKLALQQHGGGSSGGSNGSSLLPLTSAVAWKPRGEWELDPRKVLVGRRLAVGGFAEVFLGKYEGTAVAVKRLLDPGHGNKFVSEVVTLARLRHPNLILFIGWTSVPDMCIISEYMSKGSLYSIMRTYEKEGKQLERKLQRTIAISVARGMAYLHTRSPPILHLDLKSPNILADERWRIKITDFGLSRTRSRTYITATAQGGTPEWMAPEVLRCEDVNEAADVYSYGVCLWEVLTGKAPWEGYNPMQVVGLMGYAQASLPPPTEGDPFLIDLCVRCMALDQKARPLFPQIVAELDQQYGPSSWSTTAVPLLPPGPQLQALPAPPAPQAQGVGAAEAGADAASQRAQQAASTAADTAGAANPAVSNRPESHGSDFALPPIAPADSPVHTPNWPSSPRMLEERSPPRRQSFTREEPQVEEPSSGSGSLQGSKHSTRSTVELSTGTGTPGGSWQSDAVAAAAQQHQQGDQPPVPAAPQLASPFAGSQLPPWSVESIKQGRALSAEAAAAGQQQEEQQQDARAAPKLASPFAGSDLPPWSVERIGCGEVAHGEAVAAPLQQEVQLQQQPVLAAPKLASPFAGSDLPPWSMESIGRSQPPSSEAEGLLAVQQQQQQQQPVLAPPKLASPASGSDLPPWSAGRLSSGQAADGEAGKGPAAAQALRTPFPAGAGERTAPAGPAEAGGSPAEAAGAAAAPNGCASSNGCGGGNAEGVPYQVAGQARGEIPLASPAAGVAGEATALVRLPSWMARHGVVQGGGSNCAPAPAASMPAPPPQPYPSPFARLSALADEHGAARLGTAQSSPFEGSFVSRWSLVDSNYSNSSLRGLFPQFTASTSGGSSSWQQPPALERVGLERVIITEDVEEEEVAGGRMSSAPQLQRPPPQQQQLHRSSSSALLERHIAPTSALPGLLRAAGAGAQGARGSSSPGAAAAAGSPFATALGQHAALSAELDSLDADSSAAAASAAAGSPGAAPGSVRQQPEAPVEAQVWHCHIETPAAGLADIPALMGHCSPAGSWPFPFPGFPGLAATPPSSQGASLSKQAPPGKSAPGVGAAQRRAPRRAGGCAALPVGAACEQIVLPGVGSIPLDSFGSGCRGHLLVQQLSTGQRYGPTASSAGYSSSSSPSGCSLHANSFPGSSSCGSLPTACSAELRSSTPDELGSSSSEPAAGLPAVCLLDAARHAQQPPTETQQQQQQQQQQPLSPLSEQLSWRSYQRGRFRITESGQLPGSCPTSSPAGASSGASSGAASPRAQDVQHALPSTSPAAAAAQPQLAATHSCPAVLSPLRASSESEGAVCYRRGRFAVTVGGAGGPAVAVGGTGSPPSAGTRSTEQQCAGGVAPAAGDSSVLVLSGLPRIHTALPAAPATQPSSRSSREQLFGEATSRSSGVPGSQLPTAAAACGAAADSCSAACALGQGSVRVESQVSPPLSARVSHQQAAAVDRRISSDTLGDQVGHQQHQLETLLLHRQHGAPGGAQRDGSGADGERGGGAASRSRLTVSTSSNDLCMGGAMEDQQGVAGAGRRAAGAAKLLGASPPSPLAAEPAGTGASAPTHKLLCDEPPSPDGSRGYSRGRFTVREAPAEGPLLQRPITAPGMAFVRVDGGAGCAALLAPEALQGPSSCPERPMLTASSSVPSLRIMHASADGDSHIRGGGGGGGGCILAALAAGEPPTRKGRFTVTHDAGGQQSCSAPASAAASPPASVAASPRCRDACGAQAQLAAAWEQTHVLRRSAHMNCSHRHAAQSAVPQPVLMGDASTQPPSEGAPTGDAGAAEAPLPACPGTLAAAMQLAPVPQVSVQLQISQQGISVQVQQGQGQLPPASHSRAVAPKEGPLSHQLQSLSAELYFTFSEEVDGTAVAEA